jgi:hypothetical protein
MQHATTKTEDRAAMTYRDMARRPKFSSRVFTSGA